MHSTPTLKADSQRQREFPAPNQLGDFEILREIGRGGMGVVYEAIQVSLGRRVALKVLPTAYALDERSLARFLLEAQASAQLTHPHIVPVFAIGSQDSIHYFAMQRIDGTNLAAVLRERRQRMGRDPIKGEPPTFSLRRQRPPAPALDPPKYQLAALLSNRAYQREIARLGIQAARALDHAHHEGIIHRDVKPGNLLVDREGKLWVADFGLALLPRDTVLSQTGDVLGTVRYMSPEQAAGKRNLLDHRADIYSLGATLYELLTLEPASEDCLDVARLIGKAEPIPLRRHDPEIPVELEAIVLQTLAVDPAERYDTASDLADDLQRFLEDRPIQARRPGLARYCVKWCRRNPAVAMLLVIVAVLAFLLAFGAAVTLVVHYERDEARRQRHRAEEAEAAERAQHQEARERSLLAEARAWRHGGRVGQRFRALEALAQAALLRPSEELRDEAIACLMLADMRQVRRFSGYPDGSTCAGFDSKLDHYIRGDNTGFISVRRMTDDCEIARLGPGPGEHPYWVLLSPDGKSLAALYHRDRFGLHLWDVETGRLRWTRPIRGMADFHPRENVLAFNDGGKGIAVVAITGEVVRRFGEGIGYHRCAYSPDGKRLAVGWVPSTPSPNLTRILDSTTGQTLQILQGQHLAPFAWHPSGESLVASLSNTPAAFDLRSGLDDNAPIQESVTFTGHSEYINEVRLDGTGEVLATASWDSTFRLWQVSSGREILRCATGTGQFRISGNRLACVNPPAIELWEIDAGSRVCATLPGASQKPADHLRFLPGGKGLVVITRTSKSLLDPKTGKELASLPSTRGDVLLQVLPDGSLITGDGQGVSRWPVRPGANGGKWQIGPPLPLPGSAGLAAGQVGDALSSDAAGRLLAVPNRRASEVLLLDPNGNRPPISRGPHPMVARTAISPDGRWLATGTHWGFGSTVKVWDLTSDKVIDLPTQEWHGDSRLVFSSDGRWLVTTTGREHRLWNVGDWTVARILEREAEGTFRGVAAFAPRGDILAANHSTSTVRLYHLKTGRVLATLPLPVQHVISALAFDEEGKRLAVSGPRGLVHIWDLVALRSDLAAMKLDWNPEPNR